MTEALTLAGPDLKRDQPVTRLRALRPTFEKEGVTRMALIGSRARGDNRPDSDIDLMIEVDPGRKLSIIDLIGVKHIAEDHVGLSTDIILRRSLKPGFLADAERDAVDICWDISEKRLPELERTIDFLLNSNATDGDAP